MTFSVEAVVNMDNYESARFHYGETIFIEPGDDVSVVRVQLRRRVKAVVELEIVAARAQREANKERE